MSLVLIYLSTAVSFIVSSLHAAGTWAYRRSYLHRLILMIEAGYATWSFSVISVLAVDEMSFKIFMTHLRMLVVPLIYPAWVMIVVVMFLPAVATKLRKYWYLVFLVPAVVIAANLISMLGVPAAANWIYYDFYVIPDLGGMVNFSRSKLLLASFVFNAICTVLAFALLFYAIFVLRGSRRKYACVLLAVGLWPILMELGVFVVSPETPWRQLKIMVLWPFIWGLHYAAGKVDVLEITSLAQQKVFEQLPGPVVILNTRAEYWGGNAAAKNILGLKDRWQGRPAADIPVLAGVLGSGGSYQVGECRYQVLRHSLDFHSGEEQAQIFVLNDVTELEEANNTLRDLNGEILRMHRLNKEVQTVLAHDLAGALGSTQMLLNSVVRQMEDSDHHQQQQLKDLYRVHDAQQASLDLLRNILTWSHREEDGKAVEMRARVEAAIRHLAPQILQRNVKVSVDMPDHEIVLQGSSRIFETIVRNLLSNAIKFSPEAGNIQVSGAVSSSYAELTIQDEGPGISRDLMVHLSDPDFLASPREGGFGVGLKFTKDFVMQMGGVLSFAPNIPNGTRVSVKFPLPVEEQV